MESGVACIASPSVSARTERDCALNCRNRSYPIRFLIIGRRIAPFAQGEPPPDSLAVSPLWSAVNIALCSG